MRKSIYLLLFILLPGLCYSQTDISGVINDYTRVNGISGNDLTVSSTADFEVGDLVLLIQMQGATFFETNSAAFGTVTDLNNAGNYEYTTVCEISGPEDISLANINRSYTPSGIVQLIRVPVYESATIIGTLTAMPWNGFTGGVLAFECTNTLTFDAGIDVSGLGFRGGEVTTSTFSCEWFLSIDDYYYDIASGEGAYKGEGIGNFIIDKTSGRGAQTNGGGGGNDHNSGGGGGANAGAGGNGGERIPAGLFSCSGEFPGLGGKFNIFSNDDNKVFMGGAGGAGHENNISTSTRGANGGGIVMIKAAHIDGGSETINARGETLADAAQDGAGGGGGGGAVMLDVLSYSGMLNINVSGSDGGDVSNVGSSNCNGPGGGGGGGVLWVNQSSLPTEITLNNSGGVSGTTLTSSQPGCTIGGTNGAINGNPGVLVTDLGLIESFCSASVNSLDESICETDSLFLEGAWQNTAGIYYDTITTGCCDSVIATTLSIYETSSGTDVQMACDEFVWIDGITYTESNSTATYVLTGSLGCDSIVTLDLTINTVDVSLTISDPSITANATDATFKWLDCDNDFAIIPGETDATFNPSSNGSYAVEVTQGGCVDTSACTEIKTVGLVSSDFGVQFRFYPNPSDGKVYIEPGNAKNISITVNNVFGQLILEQKSISGNTHILLNQLPGIYFMTVDFGETNNKKTYKLIVE